MFLGSFWFKKSILAPTVKLASSNFTFLLHVNLLFSAKEGASYNRYTHCFCWLTIEQSSLPQLQLEMMKPNVFFSIKLDFAIFTVFSGRKLWCTIASILEQKTFQRFLFFFCGNLVFRLGTPFSASVSKNYTGIFFCRISAGITIFR